MPSEDTKKYWDNLIETTSHKVIGYINTAYGSDFFIPLENGHLSERVYSKGKINKIMEKNNEPIQQNNQINILNNLLYSPYPSSFQLKDHFLLHQNYSNE